MSGFKGFLEDQNEVDKFTQQMASIEASVSALAVKLQAVSDTTGKIAGAANKGSKEAKEGIAGATKEMDNLVASTDLQISKLDILKSKMSIGGAVTAFTGGFTAMSQGAESAMDKMLQKIPYGIGQMIIAIKGTLEKDANIDAYGRNLILGFERSGTASMDAIRDRGNQLGKEMRALINDSHMSVKEEDFGASAGAFAAGGIKMEEASTGQLKAPVKGFEDGMIMAATGIDKMFRLAAGTTAQFATELTKNVSESLPEAINNIERMGVGLEQTGVSMEQFIGTAVQLTGALRTLGVEENSIGRGFKSFNSIEAGLRGTKEGDHATGQVALGATTDITTALMNKLNGSGSQGELALIVDREIAEIEKRTGRSLGLGAAGTNLAAKVTASQQGYEGQGYRGHDQLQIRSEAEYSSLRNRVVSSNGGNYSSDIFYRLAQQQLGLNAHDALVFERSGGKSYSGSELGKTIDAQEKAKEAASKDELKMSGFEKFFADLQKATENIGRLIFGAITGLAKILISGISNLIGAITHLWHPDKDYGAQFKQDFSTAFEGEGKLIEDIQKNLKFALGDSGIIDFGKGLADINADGVGGARPVRSHSTRTPVPLKNEGHMKNGQWVPASENTNQEQKHAAHTVVGGQKLSFEVTVRSHGPAGIAYGDRASMA